MDIQTFIIQRSHFVWWTKNPGQLSVESIVEATLNYGNWDDVQKLISILGIEKISSIFHSQIEHERSNYHLKTKHFFTLYFKAHAPRNPQQ
ncbi:MAG: hypothetical protein IPN70_04670 [Candidatus Moraniibacteriota bacterium]|nr:MAG: hypothetical protein IPN70_04670 [Candidatus Moranbacteria bacterium]